MINATIVMRQKLYHMPLYYVKEHSCSGENNMEVRKKGLRFYVTFDSLGHIATRKKPVNGKNFPSPYEKLKGVFQ